MNPVRQNLVALGSAAVLAVYSAGFMRTQAAAEQFAAEDAAPRRASAVASAPTTEPQQILVDSQAASVLRSASVQDAAPTPVSGVETAKKVARPDGPVGATADRSAHATDSSEKAPTNPATVVAQVIAAAVDSSTTSAAAVAPAAPATTGSAQSAGTVAANADPSRGPYKDGRYSGWGTSRHGNIQATVEIRDGHIASAAISQCLTRYSCSWISALPPQVVARQSAEVDYVSGATQSTNAFYYAIVQALSQAK